MTFFSPEQQEELERRYPSQSGGSLDFEELLRRLQKAQMPTEEDQRAARKNAMLIAGLSMLGTPKGGTLRSLGNAGFNALAAKQDYLANIPKQKQAELQSAMQLMELQQKMRDRQLQTEQQRKLSELTQNASVPGMPAMGPPTATGELQPEVQPSFDKRKFGAGLWSIDPTKAMAFEQAQAKESPFAKIEPSKYTKESLARFVQTNNPADLQSIEATTVNKVNAADFTPQSVAKYAQSGNYADLVPKDMTAVERERLRLEQARLAQSERHFKEGQGAGQIVETAQGYARVGKDNIVRPIVAEGAQLQPKPTGAVAQQVATNAVTLRKIDRAMELVDKTPGAFGAKNVLGDPIMQRLDPAGVDARAMVADIAGQKIHDRSGAAVTVGESERLKPYIPNVTDAPDVVKKKLGMFKREYQQMQQELVGGKSLAAADAGNTGGVTGGWSIKEVQ